VAADVLPAWCPGCMPDLSLTRIDAEQ